MTTYATRADALTVPRQAGRNIAAALRDGRLSSARAYWRMLDEAARVIAAAEAALSYAEHGDDIPLPSQIAAAIEEGRG